MRERERETTQRSESIELVKILVLLPRYLGEHGLLELRQRLTFLLGARDCFELCYQNRSAQCRLQMALMWSPYAELMLMWP